MDVVYTAHVMALDMANRSCVGWKDFKDDTHPPEVQILDIHNLTIQQRSAAVSFNFSVNDCESEVTKISYRVYPIHTPRVL